MLRSFYFYKITYFTTYTYMYSKLKRIQDKDMKRGRSFSYIQRMEI